MAGRRGGLDGRPWGTCGFRKPAADRGAARARHARPYVGVRSAGVHPTRGCGAGGYEIRPYGPALGLFVGAEFLSGQWLSGAIRFRQAFGRKRSTTARIQSKPGRPCTNLPGSFIRNQASPDISSVLRRGSRASGAPGFRGMAFCHNRAGGSAPAAGIHRAPHHWPWPFPPANIQWRWTPLPI